MGRDGAAPLVNQCLAIIPSFAFPGPPVLGFSAPPLFRSYHSAFLTTPLLEAPALPCPAVSHCSSDYMSLAPFALVSAVLDSRKIGTLTPSRYHSDLHTLSFVTLDPAYAYLRLAWNRTTPLTHPIVCLGFPRPTDRAR